VIFLKSQVWFGSDARKVRALLQEFSRLQAHQAFLGGGVATPETERTSILLDRTLPITLFFEKLPEQIARLERRPMFDWGSEILTKQTNCEVVIAIGSIQKLSSI
jgi:hypothetical protein